MTLIAAVFLILTGLCNWKLSRSLMFPSVVFSWVWAAILFGLVLSGAAFYPLSTTALLVCIVSVLSFSFGSAMGLTRKVDERLLRRTCPVDRKSTSVSRILTVSLVLMLASVPVYISYLQRLRQQSIFFASFFKAVRFEMTQGETGLGPFDYAIYGSILFSSIAVVEAFRLRRGKWKAILWVVTTLGYVLLTGSRLTSIVLLISILSIATMFRGWPSMRTLGMIAACFIAIFSFSAIMLDKGGSRNAELAQNAETISRSFRTYALGGLVAFDQRRQALPEPTGPKRSLRFLCAFSRSLGYSCDLVEPIEAGTFTPEWCNVYSVFGNYYMDFGWPGLFVIFSILGVLFSTLFRHAAQGEPEAIALYGIGCAFLVMTSASDPFLAGFSACAKAVIFVICVYNVHRLWTTKKERAVGPPRARLRPPGPIAAPWRRVTPERQPQ